MKVDLYSSAYTFIDGKLAALLGERVASVMGAVQPVLMAALTLYVVLFGIAVIQGKIDEPIMDFIARAIKLVFVVAIATTPAYNEFVTGPLFTGLPNLLAEAVSGGPAISAGKPFDQFLAAGLASGERIMLTAPMLDFGSKIIGFAVILVAGLSASIGFAIFMVAKIALAMLVAIGPIFIACLVFEPSRRFFYGWLSQAVNYLVLFTLIIVMFNLIVEFVFVREEAGGAGDALLDGFLFIALTVLGTFFFLQMPVMASGIAGGAAAGIKDFQNLVPKSGGGKDSGGKSGGKSGGGSVSKN